MKKRKEKIQQKLMHVMKRTNRFFFFFFEQDSSSTCVFFRFRRFSNRRAFSPLVLKIRRTRVDVFYENGILAEEISLGRRSNRKRSVFE